MKANNERQTAPSGLEWIYKVSTLMDSQSRFVDADDLVRDPFCTDLLAE